MVPQGGAGHDLDDPLAASIPTGHLDTSPPGLWMGQAFGQANLARPDNPRASDRSRPAAGRRIEEEAPPPPGVRQGYGEELHMLADLKRDLFPWRFENVMEAGLERAPRGDVLVVDNGKAIERIGLTPPPPIEGLPIITKALVQMHGDTQAQRRTLEEASATPGLVEHVATPDMVTLYCAQRADLRGYHRMLTAWQEEVSMPEMKAGIDRFLRAVDEVEDDSKAVLAILVAALDAAFRR